MKRVLRPATPSWFFRFGYRGRTAEAVIKPGHVREEFVALGAKIDKSPEEAVRHEALKSEMANRLLPLRATDIYAASFISDVDIP